MLRFAIVSLFVFLIFTAELIIAHLDWLWFQPNLMIILIVFFNLFRGTRYSVFAALLGGLFKDSFSAGIFGLHIFSYILCAFSTTLVKMYVYQVGSMASRLLMVFLISLLNAVVQLILNLMFGSILASEGFLFVLIPEVLSTTLATVFLFEWLKQCALKLFA